MSFAIKSVYDVVHGVLCGALQAYTAYAEIYVEDLWVAEANRRRGYGRQLLTRLELKFTDSATSISTWSQMPFNRPNFI